jgi:uncharacterized protein YndB with AHSA1/START domain
MAGSIEQGGSQTRGSRHLLHFLVRLPGPAETVWPALTTPGGLAGWLTAADVLEPRLGGAVTLRELGAGRVTAWDVERVAEYTLESGEGGEGRGRIRFHLEQDGPGRSVLRFTHEYRGETAEEPRWRARFERLIEILERSS